MYTIWATFTGDVLNEESKYTTSTHAYGKAAAEPATTCKEAGDSLQFAPGEYLD